MQNTRLNTLLDSSIDRAIALFRNPWRRISLLAISLLFGFFLGGSAITSTLGQLAYWDVPAAIVTVLMTEAISFWVYRRSRPVLPGILTRGKLLADVLNALKIGVNYGLCLEAFKLNT